MINLRGKAKIVLVCMLLVGLPLIMATDGLAYDESGEQCRCGQKMHSGKDCGMKVQSEEGSGKKAGAGKRCGKKTEAGKDCGKEMHSAHGGGENAGAGKNCGKNMQSGHGDGKQAEAGTNCTKKAGAGRRCGKKAKAGKEMHSAHGSGKEMHSGNGSGQQAEPAKDCGKNAGTGKNCGKKMYAGQGGGKQAMAGKVCWRMMPQAIEPETLKNPSAPGASQFVQACGQCHGLPDPNQHKADDWGGVVERMLGKMEHSGISVPEEKDQTAILGFLQSSSREN